MAQCDTCGHPLGSRRRLLMYDPDHPAVPLGYSRGSHTMLCEACADLARRTLESVGIRFVSVKL